MSGGGTGEGVGEVVIFHLSERIGFYERGLNCYDAMLECRGAGAFRVCKVHAVWVLNVSLVLAVLRPNIQRVVLLISPLPKSGSLLEKAAEGSRLWSYCQAAQGHPVGSRRGRFSRALGDLVWSSR